MLIANDVLKGNSECRVARARVLVAAMTIFLPAFFFSPSNAVSVEPYRIRFADPLGQPWRISRYPELQGRAVRSMTEDSVGNMWFGVCNGVVRYDGIHWQDHTADEGLFTGHVESVAARPDGSIIAATQHGLFELSGNQWQRLFPDNPDVSFPVTKVIVTPEDVVWACSTWGMLRLEAGESTLYTSSGFWDAAQRQEAFDSLVDFQTDRLPSSSYPDGTGIVLAGRTVAEMSKNSPARESGLRVGDRILEVQGETEDLRNALHRDAGEQIALTVKRYDSDLPESISFQTTETSGAHPYPAMYSVMRDTQGRIWCGAVGSRIFVTEDNGTSWRTWLKKDGLYVGKRPNAIELANHDILVISTQRNGGLSRFDGSNWTRESVSHLTDSRSVATVAQTCDGTIWVTGTNQLDLKRGEDWKSHDTRVAGIPGSRHRLLNASDDGLWVLGYGQYPVRIAMSSGETMSLKNLDFQCYDTDERRWFIDSNTKRIVRYDGNSAVSFGSEDDVIDDPTGIVAVAEKGIVAFGAHQKSASVSTFDGSEWTRVDFPEVAPKLTSKGFTVASDGRVWISSRRNLRDGQAGGVIVGFGNDWQHYAPPDAPPYAMTIQEMPDGRMMFAGAFGVVAYDGTSWTQLTEKLLQDTRVPDGTTDLEGTVWLATRDRGVLRFRDGVWTAFSTDDGLLSNEVETIAVGPGQDIWASTTEGLCRFDGFRFHRVNLPGHSGRHSLRSGLGRSIWLDGNHRYVPDGQAPTAEIAQQSISIDADSNAMVTWHGVDPWNRTPADELSWSHRIDGGPWSPYMQESQLVLRDLSP